MSKVKTESIAPAEGGFSSLGLQNEILTTLSALGYEEPTPIQREAIPALLAGKDLLGQAATGTGKTAAFALPMVQKLSGGKLKPGRPRALVLVPTRELANQVAEAVHRYGREKQTSVLPIYGGQSFGQQLRVLDRGVDVVVATPGRACDHLERGTLVLDSIEMLVLDEADEMLDMGFAEDLEKILSRTPEKKQTALFSATLPSRIIQIAEKYLNQPVRVAIKKEPAKAGTVAKVKQVAYVVSRAHKLAAIGRVLDMENPTSTIVFCRTRVEVDELTEAMNAHGYRAEAIHGGFSQDQRERVLKRFRSEKTDLLIATDVAARGLDIEHVSHVINFDVPSEPEAYVHRIGRTGRAGREGVAITLAEPRERRLLQSIEQFTKQKITIANIPSAADLQTRRMERTRDAVREALVSGELDSYRIVVETLASEYEPMDVAAAAVKLVHQATAPDTKSDATENDIPSPDDGPRGRKFNDRRGAPDRHERRGGRDDRRGGGGGDFISLYVGAGRLDSLRPGDLVGAIANEAGLSGGEVGSIKIADRFSLVEVPAERAEDVIRALRKTTIRGRKVQVRQDRES